MSSRARLLSGPALLLALLQPVKALAACCAEFGNEGPAHSDHHAAASAADAFRLLPHTDKGPDCGPVPAFTALRERGSSGGEAGHGLPSAPPHAGLVSLSGRHQGRSAARISLSQGPPAPRPLRL